MFKFVLKKYIYTYGVWACTSILVLGLGNIKEQPVFITQSHRGTKSGANIPKERNERREMES